MDNIQVILYTQGGVKFDVGYIDAIPVSLNFVIADIRKPEARNASQSKTINLPGSKEVNEFFELIWETNTSLNYFNPNLKCPFYYYVNSVEQMRGDLQLLKITVDDETDKVNYEVQVTGRLGTLFKAFGDTLLTDLDFSEYDHDLTKANVTDSWATQIQVNGSPQAFALGVGYLYGLIDNGLNNGHLSEFHVKHQRPQIYKKTVLDKCFDFVGKTYSSTYFNSTYFKRGCIPATEENILLSASDIADSQFYARRSSNQTGTANNCPYGSNWTIGSGAAKDVVLFNQDNVLPYNDAGGQYNTGTGVFIVANTNIYDIIIAVKFDLTIANTVGTATNCNVSFGQFWTYLQKWNGTNWTTIVTGLNNASFGGAYPSLVLSGQIDLTVPSNTLTALEEYRVVVFPFNFSFQIYTAGAVAVTTGTTTLTPTIKTNSTYAANLKSTVVTEGYLVEMNQAIPTNLKIVDWLTSEFKLGNLYMDIDKTNSDNFIIEDRDNFYSGEVDWTLKRDIGKTREVIPMGELDWKQYDFMYKMDADEFNQAYFNTYKEIYGYGKYEVTNDFITGKTKQELIYAATPIVGNTVNGLVIPKIYKNDSGTIKTFKSIPRSLYYGGIINLSFGSWTLKSSSGDTVYTSYPFVGDCDNPYNPTLTINWDTPKAVYYSYILATYTDNNLKNRYYTRFINQITDKNSKIEKRWYNLNAYDIETFDFRKVVFDTDAYFIVNAIKDYDVLKNQSTLVELLKLADYDAYVPSNIEMPEEAVTESSRIITGNYSNGENNTNYGTNSHIVGGSGNYIAPGAKGIQLRNATNVTVAPDVENFIGDGISNRVITSADSNTIAKGNASITLITSDTTLDSSYHEKTLAVDATAGNITLTWDVATMAGCIVNLIRIDGTGSTINISDSDASADYRGAAVPQDLGMSQYDPKILTSYSLTIYRLSA